MKRPIILSLFLSLLGLGGIVALAWHSPWSRAHGPSAAKELDKTLAEARAPEPQSLPEERRLGAAAVAKSHSVPSATRAQGDSETIRGRIMETESHEPKLPASSESEASPSTLRGAREATITGRVVDKDTRGPIAGANVISNGGDSAQTDPDGNYRISGKVEELVVFAPGYAAERREIEAEPHDDSEDEGEFASLEVDFRLGQGLAVGGQVTDSSGRALPGVRVAVAPDDLVLDLSDERLEERLVRELSAVTDKAGHFRIGGLPAWALDLPGSFDLEIRLPGSGGEILETVEVEAGARETRKDLVLDLRE